MIDKAKPTHKTRKPFVEMQKELSEPFPVDKIRWRIQKKYDTQAYVLAYIDARDVMNRLDQVVGPGNWKREHNITPQGMFLCTVSIWDDESKQWIPKQDGAGETNVEQEKGGLSDSFKRACVNWGIGRYLYELPRAKVPIDKYGNFNKADLPPMPPEAIPYEERKEVLINELRVLYSQKKNDETVDIEALFKEGQEKVGATPKELKDVKELDLETLTATINYIHKAIGLS